MKVEEEDGKCDKKTVEHKVNPHLVVSQAMERFFPKGLGFYLLRERLCLFQGRKE